MSAKHPFLTWLVEHHGKADNTLGDLASELKRAYGVPSSGDLRTWLRDVAVVDQWMLDTYDTAWAVWIAANDCSTPDCTSKAAGGASHFCAPHGGHFHHTGGTS